MWAGGKTSMLKKYKELLPKTFDHYIEPFVGAGAMFVWAYKQNPNATFVINDYNKSIMAIYSAVKSDVQNFTDRVDELSSLWLPLEKSDRKLFYYDLRHQHAFDYQHWGVTKEAASLYFLMKTGFNGIWQINKNTNGRFGTACGLLNQKDKVYDKDNVLEWNVALQKCKLTSGDFGDTIIYVKPNSYVFLDPPYRGGILKYGVDFDDNMQKRVVQFLNDSKGLGAYTIMSNRDTGDQFFEKLIGTNQIAKFPVTYTAGRRKKHDDGTFSAKKAIEILMIGNPKQEIN